MKATELSNKNATASIKGVINGDDPHQTITQAKDEAKLYVGSGRYNRKDGTVNLDGVLGRSRFDRK
jgi:hypothetical protein